MTKGGWKIISSKILWTKVVIAKFISPFSREYWVRLAKRHYQNFSTFWWFFLNTFKTIQSGLVWRVILSTHVCLGIDPWSGFQQNHLLPTQLLTSLRERGICKIAHIADPTSTYIWFQGWKFMDDLGFPRMFSRQWKSYIYSLHLGHIKLLYKEDEPIWIGAKCGFYSPNPGYNYISIALHPLVTKSWW